MGADRRGSAVRACASEGHSCGRGVMGKESKETVDRHSKWQSDGATLVSNRFISRQMLLTLDNLAEKDRK